MIWEDAAAVSTPAPPQAVWDVLLDGRRWNEWNPGVAWMVVEGELQPGGLLTMKPNGAPQTAFRIERIVPARMLGLLLTFGPVAALRLSWTLESDGAGTRLEQRIRIEGVLAGLLLKKAAHKIAAGMNANLTRLCERAQTVAAR